MNKERKNLLVFGYGLALILIFFGVRLWIKRGADPFNVSLLILAFVFAAVTAIRVERLKPFYKVWMAVAHRIGEVVSSIILIVIFYGMFGTVGIILRLLGKDLLREKLGKGENSYWMKRSVPEEDSLRYTRQY